MNTLSRRDFLKVSGLALGGLAFRPYTAGGDEYPYDRQKAIGLVRVGRSEMKIYKEPSYQSEAVGLRYRDHLLYIYEKITSPQGPDFNPRWYRVEGGFAHTAYLQPVKTILNEPAYSIPEGGQLAEVTVPMTQTMRYNKYTGWQPLYRLYYQSVHWVTGVEYGPNLQPWYKILDDLLKVDYHVLAAHLRLIPAEEVAPLAVDVPPEDKRLEVNIKEQSLQAYEGDEVVLDTKVSTGIPDLLTTNNVPAATPRGAFNIQVKMPVRHMGNGQMTSDINAYELPGVPWVSFFNGDGVAFHGTYWHDNFGNEMSHGCVNMRVEEARWLWRWSTPVSDHTQWSKIGRGTKVIVS